MEEQSPAQEFLALQLCFSHLPGLAPLTEMARGESLALRYLADCGPACPTQLSRAMHVSTARIAALVRHLESKGLVLRAREPKDERKIRISLTPAGRALLQARAAQAAACAQQLLAALEPDELQQYLALQRKLLGAATEIAPSQTV